MNEYIWKRFERDQARRERLRMIRLGRVVPAYRMAPQLLVRSDTKGGWSPQIVGVN